MTSAALTITQALSPLLTTGAGAAAGAASAAGAAAAAAAGAASTAAAATGAAAFSSAQAGAPKATALTRASNASTRFMVRSLKGIGTGFAGPDTNDLFEIEDEDLAVADLAGAGGLFDGLDDLIDMLGLDGGFDFHFGQEVDHILGAPIQFGMPFLPAETLHFRDGDALHADGGQRLTHFVKLERLDDGGYEFHEISPLRLERFVTPPPAPA